MIACVPTDVLREILSRLDARDVARAACASRAFLEASEGVVVDVDPRRRRDVVAPFAERRAAYVRRFVARSAASVSSVPLLGVLKELRVTHGVCWGFVGHLPPTLERLECVVHDSATGVVHTRALDFLPALRVAKIRVAKHGGVDLVVLDSQNDIDTLHVTRAPTVLFAKAPPAEHLRLEAQLLLPRDTRLRDCRSLRLSSTLLTAAALDIMMPDAVTDFQVRTGGIMTLPAVLPASIRRFAMWGPSVIVDVAPLRQRSDTLEVVEVHARHTIGWTSSWEPPPHIAAVATVGGSAVDWF